MTSSSSDAPCSMPSLADAPGGSRFSGGHEVSNASMPSLVLASSGSEAGDMHYHGGHDGARAQRQGPKIDKQRRKTASGQTIVTTPWYPQGVLKDDIILGDEVKALASLLSLADEERAARSLCRGAVQEAVREFWPDGTVKIYGSFAVDLSLPNSALDLVCEGCADLGKHFSDFVARLPVLQFVVEGTYCVQSEGFVRVVHSSCGVTANVSFVGSKSLARKSVSQVKHLLREFPAVSPVFATVRLILQQSKCNDAKDALSSYALLIMLFSACRSCQEPGDPGALLLHFFRSFSTRREEPHVVSAAGEPGRLDNETRLSLTPGTLWVEDPLNASNNLVRDCKRFPQIRSIFHTSSLTLDKWLGDKWSGYRGRTPLSSILAYGDLWDRAGDR